MNAFEKIVSRYLEEEGYWIRQSVKVRISKEDKVAIGKFSMPTPEIDLVALNVKKNELLLVEAKSLLDSTGVNFDSISGKDKKWASHYKLFTHKIFREVVTKRLREEYLEKGLIDKNTKINYGLAAGNIHADDEPKIKEYFSVRGWELFSPKDIKGKVKELSQKGWEDDLVTITAKLILKK